MDKEFQTRYNNSYPVSHTFLQIYRGSLGKIAAGTAQLPDPVIEIDKLCEHLVVEYKAVGILF